MKRLPHIAIFFAAVLLVAADKKEKQSKPKSASDYIKSGNSFHNNGEYDKAIADYTKALQSLPDADVLRRQVDQVAELKGRYSKDCWAILEPSKRLLKNIKTRLEKSKLTPDPKLILFKKKIEERISKFKPYCDRLKKQIDEAERKLKEPLRQCVDVYNKRGFSWHKKGKYDKAIADFDEAISLYAKNSESYVKKSLSLREQKKPIQAKYYLSAAIWIDPKLAKVPSKQKKSLAWVRKMEGNVLYEYLPDSIGKRKPAKQPTNWLEEIFGANHVSCNVVGVNLGNKLVSRDITDVKPLADFPDLERLSLNWTRIRDVTPLKNLKNLKYLFLCDTLVGDLTPIKDLNKLSRLGLCCTKVKDLGPLKGLTKLEHLYLIHSEVSKEEAQKLFKILPKCKIDFRFAGIGEGEFPGPEPWEEPHPGGSHGQGENERPGVYWAEPETDGECPCDIDSQGQGQGGGANPRPEFYRD